jgi:hypothetical protein
MKNPSLLFIAAALIFSSHAAKAEEPAPTVEQRLASLEKRVTELEQKLTVKKTEDPIAKKEGVPDTVLKAIRDKASGMFPNDFATQKYYIGQQVGAWKELNGK